jgi:hypothetical protein
MKFELKTITEVLTDNEAMKSTELVSIIMIKDEHIYSCTNNITSFKDGKSAKDTLDAVISMLLKKCYPEYFSSLANAKREIEDAEKKIEGLKKFIQFVEEKELKNATQ